MRIVQTGQVDSIKDICSPGSYDPVLLDMLSEYFVTASWQDLWKDPVSDRPIFVYHDRHRDVKWTHILDDIGRYDPISGNIGAISAILEDIGVISRSVKSVM